MSLATPLSMDVILGGATTRVDTKSWLINQDQLQRLTKKSLTKLY